jgi:hypothetical protein
MSKRKTLNSLEEPLLALDSRGLLTHLRNSVDWMEANEQKTTDLRTDMKDHIAFVMKELGRIPPLEHDYEVFNLTISKMKEQMSAWSDRFVTLEERMY